MAGKLKEKKYFFVFLLKSSLGTVGWRDFLLLFLLRKEKWKRGKGKSWRDKETYINYIILGIVSVCATNIQTVAIVHWLYDPYVIPAVEKLFFGGRKKANWKFKLIIHASLWVLRSLINFTFFELLLLVLRRYKSTNLTFPLRQTIADIASGWI